MFWWVIIPVVITVYADRSFTFITKTPPAAVLIKKAAGIESGSAKPNKTKVAKITKEQVRKIAETKMPDLNASCAGTDRCWQVPRSAEFLPQRAQPKGLTE